MSDSGVASSESNGSAKTWVQFEEEDGNQQSPDNVARDPQPAVIDTQSVQVNIDSRTSPERSVSRTVSEPANGVMKQTSVDSNKGDTRVSMSQLSASQLHNVPLSDPSVTRPPANAQQPVIRQGFTNGDVIVTLLPQNSSLPWVTPAEFRPELVPEELMAQGLTLTVEDYVHTMTQLVNDSRFTLYNICYKRILMAWIILGFIILLAVLFSGLTQLALFGAGIAWLMMNAAAIFACMWLKIKLNKGLERCIAGINLQLMRHKILLGLDDRGKLSCHKVNLCFIYFDMHDCVAKLQEVIEAEESSGRTVNSEESKMAAQSLSHRMDIDDSDIIITGATNTRISRQQDKAERLYLRYSQRWAKNYLRKRLDWSFDAAARLEGLAPPVAPRHLNTARCPCQWIEEHLKIKAPHQDRAKGPCACLIDLFKDADF